MKSAYILIGFIVLLFAITLYTLFQKNNPKPYSSTVDINSTVFNVENANTPEKRNHGLSGRDRLLDTQGMFFVFDIPGHYNFWMKEMKFPLDIIFILNNNVVGVYENLQPARDADQNPPMWGGNLLSDRVLEINAGLAKKYNIKVGDRVDYNIKN